MTTAQSAGVAGAVSGVAATAAAVPVDLGAVARVAPVDLGAVARGAVDLAVLVVAVLVAAAGVKPDLSPLAFSPDGEKEPTPSPGGRGGRG